MPELIDPPDKRAMRLQEFVPGRYQKLNVYVAPWVRVEVVCQTDEDWLEPPDVATKCKHPPPPRTGALVIVVIE